MAAWVSAASNINRKPYYGAADNRYTADGSLRMRLLVLGISNVHHATVPRLPVAPVSGPAPLPAEPSSVAPSRLAIFELFDLPKRPITAPSATSAAVPSADGGGKYSRRSERRLKASLWPFTLSDTGSLGISLP